MSEKVVSIKNTVTSGINNGKIECTNGINLDNYRNPHDIISTNKIVADTEGINTYDNEYQGTNILQNQGIQLAHSEYNAQSFTNQNSSVAENEYKIFYPAQTYTNSACRIAESKMADLQNVNPNNNNINYTNVNNINPSIYHSIGESNKLTERKSDIIPLSKLNEIVLDELYANLSIPYQYIENERKMHEAIKVLTGYECHQKAAKEDCKFEYHHAVLKVFVEALTIMLTTSENMTIKNSPCVTRSKVYDKLMPYVAYENVGN